MTLNEPIKLTHYVICMTYVCQISRCNNSFLRFNDRKLKIFRRANRFLFLLKIAYMSLKSKSSKNPGLDKSNLPQISNFRREFVEKSGVQIPVKEGQIFLPLFLFIFKFSIKNSISLFLTIFEYLVLQIRYQ